MKTIITNPTCAMLTPFVESNTGVFPVQGLGFASKTGTTLKGRSIKAADTPHHRLIFYSRRSFAQKWWVFWCYELVIKKNAVRNLLSLEGVCNISRGTANVSGGGTSKSRREGNYLHFVQQGCFEKTFSNKLLTSVSQRLLHFFPKLLKS